MASGLPPTDRELLDRIIARWDLDRNEWYALSGFLDQDVVEDRLAQVARQAADEAAERTRQEITETLQRMLGHHESPRQRYERKIGAYYLKYSGAGYQVPSDARFSTGGDFATPEDADREVVVWLESLARLNPEKNVPELATEAEALGIDPS